MHGNSDKKPEAMKRSNFKFLNSPDVKLLFQGGKHTQYQKIFLKMKIIFAEYKLTFHIKQSFVYIVLDS